MRRWHTCATAGIGTAMTAPVYNTHEKRVLALAAEAAQAPAKAPRPRHLSVDEPVEGAESNRDRIKRDRLTASNFNRYAQAQNVARFVAGSAIDVSLADKLEPAGVWRNRRAADAQAAGVIGTAMTLDGWFVGPSEWRRSPWPFPSDCARRPPHVPSSMIFRTVTTSEARSPRSGRRRPRRDNSKP